MTDTQHPAPGQEPGAKLARAEHKWRAFTRFAAVLRNTALGNLGFLLVIVVAGAGWYLSYQNLHDYAVQAMGFTPSDAWLVPVVFDGAPLGLSIVVYRARLQARAALLWRVGIWAFVALSAWVNWMHAPSMQHADVLASLLPIAAVVLFEGLMNETHKAAQLQLYGGKVVPRLTVVCWLLDYRRTFRAFKTKALRPLAAAEDALEIPRSEPLPRRVNTDLEAIGQKLASDHSTAVTTPDQGGDQAALPSGEQGGAATVTTPTSGGGNGPVSTPGQTGADQGESATVTTPVATPGEQGERGVVSPSQLTPFNPLDRGPDAAREQGVNTRERVLAAHSDDPDASHGEIADQLGVSYSTVRRYRTLAKANGSH